MRTMNYVKLAFGVLFHPMDTLYTIKKHRDHLNLLTGPVFLLLLFIARVVFIFTVHTPLATLLPEDANLFYELGVIAFLLIVWSVSSFAVSSIFSGESSLKENFVATLYCSTPYLLLAVPLAVFSRVLTLGESGLFHGIETFIFVWIGFLLFLSVKQLNDYRLGTAVLVCLAILFCVAVICAILILFFSLFGNLMGFIEGIITELRQKMIS